MAISARDTEHIFERLRSGVVPERGLEAFAVGIDTQRNELHRQLIMAASGEGVFKFLRGGYGCGKTFMSRLAILDAQAQGFATSFVVVSDNDLHFYKFDDVYRKVVQELGTSACPRGALSDIIDRLRPDTKHPNKTLETRLLVLNLLHKPFRVCFLFCHTKIICSR